MNAQTYFRRRNCNKATLWIALLCAVLAACSQYARAAILPKIPIEAQFGSAVFSPAQFIVRDTQGLSGINLTCSLIGCQVLESIGDPDSQLFLIESSATSSPTAFLLQLLSASGVVDAELDQTGNTHPAPRDTMPWYASDQTPVSYYGASVWEGYLIQTPNQIVRTQQTQSYFGATGSGVTVALIDTGIDPNNNILAPLLVDGYDFTRNTPGGSEMGDATQSNTGLVNQSTAGVVDQSTAGVVDQSNAGVVNQSTAGVVDQSTAGVVDRLQYSDFGHGTMTAGIVHLVAPSAQLMPLKAFNASGIGYESAVLRAVYYAVKHQAKVISMSFEFANASLELANAISYATSQNLICVASAGNDGSIEIVYPAALPNVIDVASTSNSNTPSAFSNYGTPPVWISAPGEAVLTTYPYQTYAVGWGTSFSAPFVSGTVALMGSIAPPGNTGLLNQATAADALSHAQPIPQVQYGFGVLDSYQAVQAWQSFLNANVNVNAACSGASCQAAISGTLF